MGIYDRDYYRQPPSRSVFSGMRVWSVNTWLIIINVAVFVLNNVFAVVTADEFGVTRAVHRPLFELGYFSVAQAIFNLQVWRFVTFQFLHHDLNHILYNMLALFFFGPMVEQVLGSRRYILFYLLCGVAGPLMYIVMWALHILVATGTEPMVGASAGIFGVLIAAAFVAPDTTVMLQFLIPVKLRTLVWLMLGYAVFTVITPHGPNAGGEAAHLGGAAAGWALIKNPQLLNFAEFRSRPRMRYRG